MPYTHFRYIAYQVPTVAQGADKKAIYGIPARAVKDPTELHGNVDDLNFDSKRRIQRFIGAMLEARAAIRQRGDNRNTLKIFMAPEFYLRPAREKVSYTYKEYKAIKDMLWQTLFWGMEKGEKGEEGIFDGWLAIAGTVMWSSDEHTEKLAKRAPTGGAAYFNTAVRVHIDPEEKESPDAHAVQKSRASSIDGIPVAAQASNLVFPKQFPGKQRRHLFSAGGLRLGLDICLDHFYDGLLRPELKWERAHDDIRVSKNVVISTRSQGLHLHLLTAGGMRINTYSVAAQRGGYILRNDGYVTDRTTGFTNCKKVNEVMGLVVRRLGKNRLAPSKPNDRLSYADLSKDTEVSESIAINEDDRLYLANPTEGDDSFWRGHPQEIKIYDTQELA